jgi:serine/threonine protein kinase
VYETQEEDDPSQAPIDELPGIDENGLAPGSHLPAIISEYQLIRVAGRGGMGEVWQARHLDTRKPFAIKVLRPELVSDETIKARFVQEARVMEALVHPNILRVNHVGEQDGHLYFVMEWVEGGSLSDQLAERGTFTLKEGRDVLWQMIDGLSHAYDRGLVHRDVKPANVLMRKGVDAKVTDFGIAKFLGADEHRTGSGVRLGSPWYMSPEQIRGENVDHRSDIYSLGITLYQLLTGQVPFDGELISVLYRHVHDPLPVSFELEHFGNGAVLPILRKMTAKSPDDRYQSYDDLQFAITRLGDVVEGSGRLAPPAALQRPRPAKQLPSTVTHLEMEERLDTFHELPTVPFDDRGGVSLAGTKTLNLRRKTSASGADAADRIGPGATSLSSDPSPLLANAIRRAREEGGDVVELVREGNLSLIVAGVIVLVVVALVAGAAILQKLRPDLVARRTPSEATASTAKTPAPAAAPSPTPRMRPLQLADQPATSATLRAERLSIQALAASLLNTDPSEVLRVLGTPEFTDETKKGGGMYYSSSQWALQIYDERTSRPVQRVKVLFFNGEVVEVQGA